MDVLEDFTSGKYHRDMKILKILASNAKQLRVYGIFKMCMPYSYSYYYITSA